MKRLIKYFIAKELNKIKASSRAEFYNILCNAYNDGEEFKNVANFDTVYEANAADRKDILKKPNFPKARLDYTQLK